jgi:metal-responsive CopG/Arc/MetJ family transcriptional regulator
MKNTRFEMKIAEELLGRVDQWRGRQSDVPNRSEAIRRLIEAGLSAGEKSSPTSSGGSGPAASEKPPRTANLATRLRKPRASERETQPAPRLTKEAQLRAMREQGAR